MRLTFPYPSVSAHRAFQKDFKYFLGFKLLDTPIISIEVAFSPENFFVYF